MRNRPLNRPVGRRNAFAMQIGDSEPWGNSVSPAWLFSCALACTSRLAVRGSRHKPCAAKCFRCAKCYGYLPCIRARCEAALGEKISRGGDEKIRSDIRYRESFFESIRRYFPFKALWLRSSYGYPKPSRGVRRLCRFEGGRRHAWGRAEPDGPQKKHP